MMFLSKEVLFGDRDKAAPHLRGIISSLHFWGGMHFQAKLVKNQHLHIIETTTSLPTNFFTVIKTTEYSSWLSKHAHNKFKMADGRKIAIILSQELFDRLPQNFAQ